LVSATFPVIHELRFRLALTILGVMILSVLARDGFRNGTRRPTPSPIDVTTAFRASQRSPATGRGTVLYSTFEAPPQPPSTDLNIFTNRHRGHGRGLRARR
jgi:hypothetical protein